MTSKFQISALSHILRKGQNAGSSFSFIKIDAGTFSRVGKAGGVRLSES